MSVIIKLKVLFLGLVLCQACIDPIDLEIGDEFSDSLVLQGRIVKGEPSFIEVNVSRLFDFSPESRQPIGIDEVIVFDDQGNQIELTTRSPGSYREVLDSSSPIQAVVGRSYMVRAKTFDGRTIESNFDDMLPNMDPIGLSFMEVDDLFPNTNGIYNIEPTLQVLIDTDIAEESDGGLFWEIQSIFKVTDLGLQGAVDFREEDSIIMRTCYINKIASTVDISVLDLKGLNKSEIKDFNVVSMPMELISKEGHYFEVKQYSLSEAATSYWNKIDILNSRTGRLFEQASGELPSNLSVAGGEESQVFGFFYASEEKMLRKRVPDIFYQNLETLCTIPRLECFNTPFTGFMPTICACQPCCDCRDVENSSESPPDFWEDF